MIHLIYGEYNNRNTLYCISNNEHLVLKFVEKDDSVILGTVYLNSVVELAKFGKK